MAGRHYDDRVCCCDRADANCAGLIVRQLSQERAQELAEEIWAAAAGGVLPGRPALDPRSSHAGASAQAAYRRHRQQEREAWRPNWYWRAGAVVGVAVGGGLAAGQAMGERLGWLTTLLIVLLAGWRLRFRPSASTRVWRRQAATQRRTAGVLRPLEDEGYLILHDITLPGCPAALDHLVAGPTGVWVIKSWQRARPTLPRPGLGANAAVVGQLRGQAATVADILANGASVSVRAVLCVHRGGWLAGRRSIQDVKLATPRQLADSVRHAAPLPPSKVEWATARLLELLRPAA